MKTERKREGMGKLMLLAATLIWGTSFFILKNSIDALPTCLVLGLRFAIAVAVLALVCPKKFKMPKRVLVRGLVLGVILAAAYGVQTFGLKYTTPSKNSFLTAAYVAVVPFLAWAINHRRPNRYNIAGAALCFLGVLIVAFGDGAGMQLGDALTLLCSLFYALQIIFLRRYGKEEDSTQLLIVELTTVGVIFLSLSACFELPRVTLSIGWKEMLPVLYLAVFATCGAQWLQTAGQKRVNASQASLILSLEAVFGAIFSAIFYHEKMSANLIVGFFVIFIAVVIGETQLDFLKRKPRGEFCVGSKEKEMHSFKLLSIGNSFSDDTMEYVHEIATSMGAKNVVLGNLYIGGCSLALHWDNAKNDRPAYEYRTYRDGEWHTQAQTRLSTALSSERWEFVSLQQASAVSGVPSSYKDLDDLKNYVKGVAGNPDLRLIWNMTWAYQGDSGHPDFPTYGCDQVQMYRAIAETVQKEVLSRDFYAISPAGTAIQNARTSYLGDTLTRDGFHLSLPLGRYLAGLTMVGTVTGADVRKATFLPEGLSEADLPVLVESVENALKNPFKITPSERKERP